MSVFAVDPGVADTGTQRDYPWPAPMKAVLTLARPLLHRLLSAEKAAHSSIQAASAAELGTRTGLLLDRRGRPMDPPPRAGDLQIAQIVDATSRELVELDRLVTATQDRPTSPVVALTVTPAGELVRWPVK